MTITKSEREELAIQDQIRDVSARIVSVTNDVLETGRAVARCIDTIPDFSERLMRFNPKIGTHIINCFEKIGRRQMHPALMWDATPGAEALRKLPYSLQERYVDNSVPLLVKTERGWESLQVKVSNLSRDQAMQVFNRDTVRTEAQQRTWIEDKKTKTAIKNAHQDEPYRIVGKELIVIGQCRFTAKDLSAILSKLT